MYDSVTIPFFLPQFGPLYDFLLKVGQFAPVGTFLGDDEGGEEVYCQNFIRAIFFLLETTCRTTHNAERHIAQS